MTKKLAIISGSTKGIGRAIAEIFAKQGLTPVINGRNKEDLTQAVKEINAAYNCQCLSFAADLSKKEEAIAFAKFIEEQNTEIAALVNNTGVFIPSSFLTEEKGTLETMIDTNLYSAYYLTKGLLPTLIKQQSGHVFTICSVASLDAYPQSSSYTVSKFALLGFTKSLRAELKEHKIKVSAILPGATFTQSWDGIDLPKNRFIQPADIAETIWAAYQLSDSAVLEEIIIRPQLGDI